MKITFGNNNLKKYANNDSLAERKLGKREAQLFKQRLDDLTAAKNLEDVRYLPGKYHELIGNRKGQWACNLVHPYRLIFEPLEDPIPENENGQYLWIEIKGVELIEIEDYH
ncbi:type II toxin-antitoxin system RelE/ParE family toxin [Mariniflexile ostreae]|uniref:Type II toxin-antitoxin system RelE/ParE family toxin n=1 Tax=Mariniflexile ostreae TaxID=1520892 RepID=A0ABV5FBG1_9FLAO